MKFVSSITKLSDLEKVQTSWCSSFLIDLRLFSRTGELAISDLKSIFVSIPKELRVFNWNILMTEKVFAELDKDLLNFPWEEFSAVRIQDLGILEWLRDQNIKIPVELNLETGHHNWSSIESHLELYPEISRVVLSQELEKNTILEYLKKSNIQFEEMGFGPTLLFYTPRSLLSPFAARNDFTIKATATSEESAHKGFPIVENRHGTFMFNTKDHSILEHLFELSQMSNFNFRLDVSWSESFDLLCLIKQYLETKDEALLNQIAELNPRPLHKAFFRSNKSDVLFKKLKNAHLSKIDEKIFARVLEQDKNSYTAIKLNQVLKKEDLPLAITLHTTEGQKLSLHIGKFTDVLGREVERLEKDEIALVNPLKKASVKSLLVKEDNLVNSDRPSSDVAFQDTV